jgi:Alpha-L-arabinofuranosidase B (ABFB) domain
MLAESPSATQRKLKEVAMHAVPKFLALGLAVFALLSSKESYAQEHSYQSVNFPDRFIRHRNFLGFIEQITDEQAAKDAVFVAVPGLAGRCHSLEAKNFPGSFLRHQNSRLKLSRADDSQLFREDATFCFRDGLVGHGFSFESVNFPNQFIRHRDFELMISPNDGTDGFKRDATFIEASPARAP